MSDIVGRLRGFLNRTDKQNHQDAIAAADEIERLRNALDVQIQAARLRREDGLRELQRLGQEADNAK